MSLKKRELRYNPLPEKDLKLIKRYSSKVLAEAGIRIEHEDGLKSFYKAGADVDFKQQMVKIPILLQKKLLKKVPQKISLYGLDSEDYLELNCQNVYTGTGGNVSNILDINTGKRRPSLLSDLSNIAHLVQHLENIDFFIIPVFPNDVSAQSVDVNSFYHSLINTQKHVMGGIHYTSSINRVIDLAAALAGGEEKLKEKPIISFIASITSPRRITKDNILLIKTAAERGIPIAIAPAPIAGISAPVTLMGTLIQQNAETLAGLMLAQTFKAGALSLYGAVNSTADFRTMSFLFGSSEMAIMNAAAVQVAHSYNFPLYASAGLTESKVPDGQGGIEKTYSLLMTALAGGDYIHLAAGMLDSALTVAYEQYVMDNEILGMIKRAVMGIGSSKEHAAFEEIKKVPPGGSYMSNPLTVKYMRLEYYFSHMMDRNPYAIWEQKGSSDLRQRCNNEAKRVIATYDVNALECNNIFEKFPELILRKDVIPGI